ncbi:hypothetical protein RCL1_002445 [Eukaryota sp. TZLM3-RCL]
MSKAVQQAKKVATIQISGEKAKKKAVRRTSVTFRRPKTVALPRTPKFPRRAITSDNKLDRFQLIRQPLTTESAMKLIEGQNTLVFIVDRRATKNTLAKAIKDLYNVEPMRINTLHTANGQKKAFVRLAPSDEALVVANSIGLL